jgi:hypothetical protein
VGAFRWSNVAQFGDYLAPKFDAMLAGFLWSKGGTFAASVRRSLMTDPAVATFPRLEKTARGGSSSFSFSSSCFLKHFVDDEDEDEDEPTAAGLPARYPHATRTLGARFREAGVRVGCGSGAASANNCRLTRVEATRRFNLRNDNRIELRVHTRGRVCEASLEKPACTPSQVYIR